MSILAIDDAPEVRTEVRAVLQEMGYAVRTAATLHEAFQELGLADPQSRGGDVDLILLDTALPEMTGIEACALIKAHPGLQEIPVVMLAAENEVWDLQLAFAAGAVDYLQKPAHRLELLARVRRALRQKHEIDRRRSRELELVERARELEDGNRTLQEMSYVDPLTRAANRRHFDEFLDREWRRGLREERPVALILADVDALGAYNDQYGLDEGDTCLRTIAAALRARLGRAGDLVARFDGDEFAAVLPGTDLPGARAVAEALRERVEQLALPHSASPVSDHVTITLGVGAAHPAREASSMVLLTAAQRALEAARQAGGNRVAAEAA